jgi:hypothetical protein
MSAPDDVRLSGNSWRLIRVLVVLQWALGLASAAAWYLTEPPAEVQACMRALASEPSLGVMALTVVGGAVFIVASTGLFLSRQGAAPLYVAGNVLVFGLALLEGPTCVPSGWISFLNQATALVVGATLGRILLPPP